MKLTNNDNLPEALYEAIKNDPYTKGKSDISITTLIAPARIRVLEKRHRDEIVEDAADQLNLLLGQLMHGVLERANRLALSEKRFYLKLDGVVVSGQMDVVYEAGKIQDYKLVSTYSVKDGVKDEYVQQLNCYAYLVKHGYYIDDAGQQVSPHIDVKTLEDVFILRDWTKGKARMDRTMPQKQVLVLNVPLWPEAETLAFIEARLHAHKAANKVLPECTKEERWATEDKWAVMPKKGAARSLKNHSTKEAAEEHASNVTGAFVEDRPGESKRCADYCVVNKWCTQFKTLKGE